MRNVEDNTSFESDFLSDIDLSNASPNLIMYLRIISNITLKAANRWKKIQKQALIKEIDIVKTKMDSINTSTLVQASIKSMLAIEAFELVLINFSLLNLTLLQLLYNISLTNTDYKAVANYINAVLSLNIL